MLQFYLHLFKLIGLLLSFLIVSSTAIELSECISPLGMESGTIKDEDIEASSSFDSGNVGPQYARVRTEKNGGAWCPQTAATSIPEEWIQVDLHSVHLITSIGTQGRFGNGQGVEYAESYVIEYWRPRLSQWIRYRDSAGREVVEGNKNTYLEAKVHLDNPIWASKVRIYPYSDHTRTVCMRIELYGCRWLDGVVSYSMPQGDKRGANWEFYDTSYDGYWDGNELKDGLGLLTDGRMGAEDYKMSFYEPHQKWVGWRNDTRSERYVDILFEFDKVREFTAVQIFSNNQFTRDVQVFAKAHVTFSVGGKRHKGEPITFDYMEECIFEAPRNVTIKLHNRVGRFVRVRLFFAVRWILISEVSFISNIFKGNFSVEEEPSLEEQSNEINATLGTLGSESQVTKVNFRSMEWMWFVLVPGGAVFFCILIVVYAYLRQEKKTSLRHTQINHHTEKTALYNEPSYPTTNSSYADVRDPEYAVPIQTQRAPPRLQDILPHPPPIPPTPERYYAATDICNSRFVPPSPPASTPPLSRINRQPRFVTNTNTNMYIGP